MKKMILVLVSSTALFSCNKECTCDLNSYVNTGSGWYLQSTTTVTAEGLCKEEGTEATVNQGGVQARSVYENCK